MDSKSLRAFDHLAHRLVPNTTSGVGADFEVSRRRQQWTKWLTAQADVDHSGFVSPDEASAISTPLNDGLNLLRDPQAGLERLTKQQGKDAALGHLREYSRLQIASKAAGLDGLPPLPKEIADLLADAPGKPAPPSSPTDRQ